MLAGIRCWDGEARRPGRGWAAAGAAWLRLWLAAVSFSLEGASLLPQGEWTIQGWQAEDGLPQSSVKSIVQTPDGYLWLATFGGLARFDGVRFTQFDTANLPGLPGNRLVDLSVGQGGSLWIVTEYNEVASIQNGMCKTFGKAEGVPAQGAVWVRADGAGGPWLAGAKGGLFRWESSRFVPVRAPPEFAVQPPRGMVTDGNGRLWFNHPNGLYGFEGGRVVPVPQPEEGLELQLFVLCARREGGLWAITSSGLRRFQDEKWQPEVWACPDFGRVVDACEDLVGNLWIATYDQGLFRFSPAREWEHFTVESGLPTLSVRALFCDPEGDLWVGTDGEGVVRLRSRLWRMITRREGLGVTAVHSISQDAQGRIWLVGGTTKPYWLEPGKRSGAVPPPGLDVPGPVWAVLCARDGAVWIGTYLGELARCRDGSVVTYGLAEGMVAGSVRALMEDRRGSIWVGGFKGLCRLDHGQMVHYGAAEGLSSEKVSTLAEGAAGCVYIGTSGGGLNVLRDGRVTVYVQRDGLPDNYISALYVDAEDTLWIGTRGGGLSRFKAGRFFNFYHKGGLPARRIGPILEDDSGRLWMASVLGIVCVSRQELNGFAEGRLRSLNYVDFDRSDGLVTSEVGGVQPACMKARDGTLWFGSSKGAAYVDPKELRVNSLPPPVTIEEVRIDEVSVPGPELGGGGATEGPAAALVPLASSRSSPGSNRVILRPHQRRIEFRFTGLSYAAPSKVRFRYRMVNFDPDWVEGGAARSVSYTRLPPGHYRFEVTACNNDGVWNPAGASLGVVVVPAVHQTWWFRLLALALVSGAVGLLFWLRLSHLKQVARLRGRIAGDLHDEIGSNIGGILLLSELTQQNPDLPAEAQASLREINLTAHRSASAMRDIVWFLNPDFDQLDDMVARMREFAGSMLAGLDHEFEVSPLPPARNLPLEFRRNFFFAFKEIVHNIVKHAQATRVRLRLEVADRRLTLRVEDNGRGFTAGASSGHGLRSLRRRAEDLGGQASIESAPGKGTVVTLTTLLP